MKKEEAYGTDRATASQAYHTQTHVTETHARGSTVKTSGGEATRGLRRAQQQYNKPTEKEGVKQVDAEQPG